MRLRAQTRRAVTAGRLAQHERARVARDLGGAVARRAIDDDDRSDRSMRESAQQRREGRRVIARRHDDVDQQPGHGTEYGTRAAMALTYKDAGVDIDAGNALVARIKPLAKSTTRPEVLGGIGG